MNDPPWKQQTKSRSKVKGVNCTFSGWFGVTWLVNCFFMCCLHFHGMPAGFQVWVLCASTGGFPNVFQKRCGDPCGDWIALSMSYRRWQIICLSSMTNLRLHPNSPLIVGGGHEKLSKLLRMMRCILARQVFQCSSFDFRRIWRDWPQDINDFSDEVWALLDSKLLHSFCWCNSLGETIPITKQKVIQTILLKWNACFHGPSHVCNNYRGLSVASCQVDRNQSGKKLSDFGWQDTNWLKCRVKCLVTRYAKVAMCTNMENPWCIFIQLCTSLYSVYTQVYIIYIHIYTYTYVYINSTFCAHAW